MAAWDEGTGGILTTRSINAAGGSVDASKKKARADARESQSSQNYSKKKKDALQGKDTSKAKGGESDSEEGRGSDKKGEGGGSGSRGGSQNLQSGQTTVQFSSGDSGGMATALGSLLALFSSSASLVRAETGAILAVSSQTALSNLRYAFQISASQTSGLVGGEKNAGNIGLSSGQADIVDIKFNLEGAGGSSSHGFTSSENALADLLASIKLINTEKISAETEITKPTIVLEAFSGISILTVNTSGTFFPPNTQFAFSSLPTSLYRGVVNDYFTALLGNGAASGSYSYTVLGPVLSDTSLLTGSNITINNSLTTTSPLGIKTTTPLGATSVDVAAAATPITSPAPGSGLTISQGGDLYVAVASPLSVLLAVKGGNTILPVRIDVGPGAEVTKDSLYQSTMFGLFDPATQQFQPTVFRDGTTDGKSGKTTVVGNGEGITVGATGTVNYYTATPTAAIALKGFNIPLTGSTYTYAFPSSTIFRHIGTSIDPTSSNAVPTEATYGNFSAYAPVNTTTNIVSSITLPNVYSSDNLTFGGNVLDVFGTKYGVGDALNIILPASTPVPAPTIPPTTPPPLPTNTITFKGDTVAGFGLGYGDLQALTISAVTGDSAATVGATNIIFNGNNLAVDKSIASTLYPDLQTLDLENYMVNGAPAGSPSNIHIVFSPSILEGNTGFSTLKGNTGDIFYGDIRNLSTNSAGSYNGFINPVTVTRVNGQVVTTTTDGNNNSIAWTSDIYGQESTVTAPDPKIPNTYDFTLLLDAITKAPVMPGDPLITDFKISTDPLIYEITPSVFRALEGAALNAPHDKTINVADLNALVTVTAFTFDPSPPPNSPPSSLTALEIQYLTQRYPGQTLMGVTFNFDVANGGGSLTLIENAADTTALLGTVEGTSPGFSAITNLSFMLTNYDTAALVAVLSPTTANTPLQTPPYIYNEGPIDPKTGGLTVAPYFNELDNFFANSLFATYSISGTGVTPGSASGNEAYPITPGTTIYRIAPGVTIDEFGTIDVTAAATTPVLMPLTITATQHLPGDLSINGNTATLPSTAASPELFGFLYAPITHVPDGGSTLALTPPMTSTSNIIIGGAASTLIGEPSATLNINATGGSYTESQPAPYGGNLIVSTAGGSTATGDFTTITFSAEGTGGLDAATAPATPGGAITGSAYEFNANAFDVTTGTVYGVDQNFNIAVQGASAVAGDTTIITTTTAPLSLIDSGQFNNNHVNFDAQTIYGSGKLDGDGQNLTISATAGTGKLYVDTTDTSTFTPTSSYGTLDVSGQVENDIFTFKPVNITMIGDVAATQNIISPYLETLTITAQPTFAKITTTAETLDTSAHFSGNQFIFQGATIDARAALGNTTINADVNLDNNPSLYAYRGFDNGVTVSSNAQDVVITTADGLNNSMTFGNKTITEGAQSTTINFNLIADTNGDLVLMGNTTITNPNSTGTIDFNVDSNAAASLPSVDGAGLDSEAIFSHPGSVNGVGGNTVIDFLGGGTLTLDGVYVTSFSGWNVGGLNITALSAPPPPAPTLNPRPVFDPVFLNGVSQPNAFAGFISGANPQSLSYVPGVYIPNIGTFPFPLPSGLTLSVDGTLTVNVTDPISDNISVVALGGATPIQISPHIFATNAPFIDYDTTSSVIGNNPGITTNPGAYEVMAGTVYGSGGGSGGLIVSSGSNTPIIYQSNLIYDLSTVTHAIFGDVANISNATDVSIKNQTFIFNDNLMNINPGSSNSDVIDGTTKSLIINAPTSASDKFEGNEFDFGAAAVPANVFPPNINGNTIYGSGSVFGDAEVISFNVPGSASGTINATTVDLGGNHLTSGVYLNGSDILTPDPGFTNLYAGIKEFDMTGTASQIINNALIFHDSTLTGLGSTLFYNDIHDLSQTDFGSGTVTAGSLGGQLQISDSNNNLIDFGNNTMNPNTTPGTINIFDLGLLINHAGNLVSEGNTTINNFATSSEPIGAGNPNILNINLFNGASGTISNDASPNVHPYLLDDTLTTSSQGVVGVQGFQFITSQALNQYMNENNGGQGAGGIAQSTLNGVTSTHINFSDTSGVTGGNLTDLGSITLGDVNVNRLIDLGTNIEVTSYGVTNIAAVQNNGNIFNVVVPGDSLAAYTQDTHILSLSGDFQHIVDMQGEVDIHLSNALFNKLGLSDANTAAQNFQILQNDVITSTGGVAVSFAGEGGTSYSGSSTASAAVLTFESMNGASHYGTITLHSVNDVLTNHILITHS